MAHAQPCANCPHGLCSSSYDGFPELKAELFESPQEQQGALPVPGPSRSAPSSPAPRRTKQVTSGGPCRGTGTKAIASWSNEYIYGVYPIMLLGA